MRPIVPNKISQWLLPTVLILFILEVLLLPFVVEFTYAGSSEGPDHILTYTTNSLVWDSATGIDEYGVAKLTLFDAVNDSGDAIVAPGMAGGNIIRLKNDCGRTISFTAVLYRIRTNDALPVDTALDGEGFADTDVYALPTQVEEGDVVRAVSGELPADQIQDFDISWVWEYSSSEEQDRIDSILGSAEKAEQITVGLYIVVEDQGEHIDPTPPPTGDNSYISMYLTLMGISLIVLLLLLWDRNKREQTK
ncbi:MAG: hypothetical protein IKY59_00670 [Oscillospiraceae bacterium]|nr:hypothetical protein [Oscillospiraceae bacterium]